MLNKISGLPPCEESEESNRKFETSLKITCAVALTAFFTTVLMICFMSYLIDSRLKVDTGYSVSDLLEAGNEVTIGIDKPDNNNLSKDNFVSSSHFKAIRSFMKNADVETLSVKMEDGRTFNVNLLP